MEDITYLIIWFVLGFIGFAIMSVNAMRGKEYNESYFLREDYTISGMLVCICMGLISFIGSIMDVVDTNNYTFTKLLYKIANIGIKKDEDEGE